MKIITEYNQADHYWFLQFIIEDNHSETVSFNKGGGIDSQNIKVYNELKNNYSAKYVKYYFTSRHEIPTFNTKLQANAAIDYLEAELLARYLLKDIAK